MEINTLEWLLISKAFLGSPIDILDLFQDAQPFKSKLIQ